MASSFEEAIKQRQSNNIKSELTFIGIKETNLEKFERVKNNFFCHCKVCFRNHIGQKIKIIR